MDSLQERYAPNSICFGCGPANAKGLRIRSFESGDEFVCDWTPEPHHEAFPGMLNGGITGALLDCHANWSAAVFLMKKNGLSEPACTVTAEFSVKLRRPIPSKKPLRLVSRVLEARDDRATIEAELWSEEALCATLKGLFVAVKPGHPAYHRWAG